MGLVVLYYGVRNRRSTRYLISRNLFLVPMLSNVLPSLLPARRTTINNLIGKRHVLLRCSSISLWIQRRPLAKCEGVYQGAGVERVRIPSRAVRRTPHACRVFLCLLLSTCLHINWQYVQRHICIYNLNCS